jgi:hypothetical protein
MVRAMTRFLLVSSLLVLGCKPEFDDRASQIGEVRILAVRSVPAESVPGKDVSYTALVVDQNGSLRDAPVDWAYCTEPKPLDELNDVSVRCFRGAADWIVPLGTGLSATGTLPSNACRQFGSDVPEPKPGEPPGRPTDPDSTGGYYQPLRLLLAQGSGYVFGLGTTRLQCGLPGATREVLEDFTNRYRRNENPVLSAVESIGAASTPLTKDDATTLLVVRPGDSIRLRASWPTCPSTPTCGDKICSEGEDAKSCPDDCTTPVGCTGAEYFVSYDVASRALLARHESMRVSWFSGAGSFAEDRTGRAEDDLSTSSENTWTAPNAVGRVPIWVVLRDGRGGVSWDSYAVDVN